MTSQDIVNTLDPDKWQCDMCDEWKKGKNCFYTLVEHNDKRYTVKICSQCWNSLHPNV